MKWFMATNEDSIIKDQFFDQVKVAILSAKKNTSLIPYMLYDGIDNERIAYLRELGVTILPHTLSFKSEISKYVLTHHDKNLLDVRSGAYLRYEIPLAMRKNSINDKYVLYTDCDVVFLNEIALQKKKPKYIAACGNKEGGFTSRFHIGGWWHFNSGILLINVNNMGEQLDNFRDYVLNNGYNQKRYNSKFMQKNLFMSDQVAINYFYKNRIKKLSWEYNWHPSYGINEKAKIIHFNGLKWTQWDDFLHNKLAPEEMEKFARWVSKNREGYEYYVNLAKSYIE